MSMITTKNGSDAMPTSSHALIVIPTRQGDGFKACIHGHMLELG
jgi:hypothetical protein